MLSSLQIEAFLAVARTLNISQAAKNLHLTQSALSQRILNLEAELETTLLLRQNSGLQLTETGEKLLRYCQLKENAEQEFLESLAVKGKELTGILRIGSFSTLTRSILIPLLTDFRKQNPSLQIEISTRELYELPRAFCQNQFDFIFTNQIMDRQDVISVQVGMEKNVLVESAKVKTIADCYLDHDPTDRTTFNYLKLQKKDSSKIKRCYLDEIYSILDAVKAGWGRAVVPSHLVHKSKDFKIVPGRVALELPIFFHYWRQPYYTRLQKAFISMITGPLFANCPSK